ncbi:sulfite oxidase heme-binding subunit YedZ [Reinekea marinisedimentorum]|uniref:sulfite oxidase heme-binding subunit YedZ n=1 Tax=Reinekea marinisedimentorum TaxID=230495 RepID=UPI00105125EF|nr:protein-methionine-sulfoxide reductase heme-binding subunit MsrQ [Reinekea marinisedimentorum]
MNRKLSWWLVFIACASPSLYLLLVYFINPRSLGIDPVEVLLAETGEWSLRFLLITLACSPLRRLKVKRLARYRRMLGLYSFYYASLHLAIYVSGWIQFDWQLLVEDLISRPFIYIGMAVWLVLMVLAITSPKAVIKRLKKWWLVIHRFVYVAAFGALVHLWMQSRGTIDEVLVYGALLFLLLAERIYRSLTSRNPVQKRSAT